jgi:hypothetical protein
VRRCTCHKTSKIQYNNIQKNNTKKVLFLSQFHFLESDAQKLFTNYFIIRNSVHLKFLRNGSFFIRCVKKIFAKISPPDTLFDIKYQEEKYPTE